MLHWTQWVLSTFILVFSLLSHAENLGLPDVNARYETLSCHHPCKKVKKTTGWLMRTGIEVEYRNIEKNGQLADFGEIWKRDNNGNMGYVYMMHKDQRAIEYLQDDLKLLGIPSDEEKWQTVAQLITANELHLLSQRKIKTSSFKGFPTQAFYGKLKGAKVNVLWSQALNLPVKLEYSFPKSKVTMQLQEIFTSEDLSIDNKVPKTSEQTLASYQQVYFTDIGDMEQSDDAKEWIEKAHGAPGLHHHQH